MQAACRRIPGPKSAPFKGVLGRYVTLLRTRKRAGGGVWRRRRVRGIEMHLMAGPPQPKPALPPPCRRPKRAHGTRLVWIDWRPLGRAGARCARCSASGAFASLALRCVLCGVRDFLAAKSQQPLAQLNHAPPSQDVGIRNKTGRKRGRCGGQSPVARHTGSHLSEPTASRCKPGAVRGRASASQRGCWLHKRSCRAAHGTDGRGEGG